MFKFGTPYKRRGPSVKPRHVKLQVQHARKREEHTETTKKFLDSDAGQWTCFWIASACPHDKACGMARDEVMDKTVKIRLPDVDNINGYPQLLEKKTRPSSGECVVSFDKTCSNAMDITVCGLFALHKAALEKLRHGRQLLQQLTSTKPCIDVVKHARDRFRAKSICLSAGFLLAQQVDELNIPLSRPRCT